MKLTELEKYLLEEYQKKPNRQKKDKNEFDILNKLNHIPRTSSPIRKYNIEKHKASVENAKRSPNQVVFKILKGAPKGYGVKRVLMYIAQDGQNEIQTHLETQDGIFHKGEKEINDLYQFWKKDFSNRANGKDAMHLILSTQAKKNDFNFELIKDAARSTLQEHFNDRGLNYAFAIHKHGSYPHVHILLNKKNQVTNKSFNFKKDDPLLFAIRKTFSDELIKRGLERKTIDKSVNICMSLEDLIKKKNEILIKKSQFEAMITKGENISTEESLQFMKDKKFFFANIQKQIGYLKENKIPESKDLLKELQQIKRNSFNNLMDSKEALNFNHVTFNKVNKLIGDNIKLAGRKVFKKIEQKDYSNYLANMASQLVQDKLFLLKYYPKDNQTKLIRQAIDKRLDDIDKFFAINTIHSSSFVKTPLNKVKKEALEEFSKNTSSSRPKLDHYIEKIKEIKDLSQVNQHIKLASALKSNISIKTTKSLIKSKSKTITR